MVIRAAKKYSSEGTVQKKNKMKKAPRNPVVVIIDDDGDAQFGLPTKAKEGRKKHSVEGNSSVPKKKKKKKKKPDSKLKNEAFIDLPITIQSSSDLGSVKAAENPPKALKKKRKRGLSRERESSPEIPSQGQTIHLEANVLVRKKCQRSVPETCGGNSEYARKRKKKKHRLACSLIPSHAEDDYPKKDLPPAMEMISHEMMLSNRKRTLIQDDVSKGKSKPTCCLTSVDSQETRSGVLEKGTADPTCELQEENNRKPDHKDTAHASKKRRQVTEQEGKKKKKKKKKKLKEEEVDFLLRWTGNQENHPAVSTETLWKTKSEKKMKKIDLIQNSKGDSKGHKKKKIYTEVAGNSPDLLEDNKDASDWGEIAAATKKTKKKAQQSKKERDPAARLGSSSSGSQENSGQQCDATKMRAKKREGPGRAEEEPSSKPAKVKIKAEKSKDEIQVIAIKKGNCDEVTIDKLRRQALQEEIDRESGKTKPIKKEDESDHHFGQWSTAAFDSAERKTRFLRLLGGFKKGPVLAQESPAKATKHNMALARHGEEKLQQTLQAEFEKALAWKQRGGAGLGFQLAPQKQVYIDKYASKSVKFKD